MLHAFVDFKNRVKSNFGPFSLTLVDSILRESADFRFLLRVSNAYDALNYRMNRRLMFVFFVFSSSCYRQFQLALDNRFRFFKIQLCLRCTVIEQNKKKTDLTSLRPLVLTLVVIKYNFCEIRYGTKPNFELTDGNNH